MNLLYDNFLTKIYCGDALEVMEAQGKFDFCLLDAPWDKPMETWIGPYLNAARARCKTVLINGGPHCDNVRKAFPPDATIWLRHEHSGESSEYLVYGEAPESLYTSYMDDGTREPWHHGSQPLSRSEAILDLFPDTRSVLEPFMGSATILRVARQRGIFGVGSDIVPEYCEKVISLLKETDLTVIIPTLIHTNLLEECLQTFKHHAAYPARVLVVDSSEDLRKQREVDAVAKEFEVLHLNKHRGEQYAINRAVEHVKTPYFCLIHDDATFIPNNRDFFPRLLDVIRHEEVGMCGPALSNCTGLQHFLRWNSPLRHEVDYLYGACMMFRTNFYREIGGFDEAISPCDDVDLAVRVKAAGKKIVVDRGCFLYHHRHQTFKFTRPAKTDVTNLEEMFNKLIRKHGVHGFMDHLMTVPDWHWIMQTCPTWADITKRLSAEIKEWKPGYVQRRRGSAESVGSGALPAGAQDEPHMGDGPTASGYDAGEVQVCR